MKMNVFQILKKVILFLIQLQDYFQNVMKIVYHVMKKKKEILKEN